MKGQFIVKFDWMFSELDLKSTQSDIYSLIYGYSQDGNSVFRGSLTYIANFLNVSKKTVSNNLESLIEKGLIDKEVIVNGLEITRVEYSVNLQVLGQVNENVKPKQKKKLFIKPTEQQAIDFFNENESNNYEAYKFWNYYDSKGWKVGKSNMKNWKSAAKGWIKRAKSYEQERNNNTKIAGTNITRSTIEKFHEIRASKRNG